MNPNNNLEPREEDADDENGAVEIEWISHPQTNRMRSRGCFKLLRYAAFIIEIVASVTAVLIGLWLSVTIAYNMSLTESEQLHYKQNLRLFRNDTDSNETCVPDTFFPSNRKNNTEYCYDNIPVSNGIFLALGITIIAVSVARIITMMIFYKKTPTPNEKMMMKAPFIHWCLASLACILCETRATHHLYQMAYSRNPPIHKHIAFTNDRYNHFYYGCMYMIFNFAQDFYYIVLSKVAMFFAHAYCKYADCEADNHA